MSQGYIKLHRKIQECWIWERDDYLKAWIDLLLMANHTSKKIMFDGKLTVVEKGQFVTSILKLGVRWKWDRKKVTRFLDVLESDGMITKTTTTHGTTISIVNWDKFQVEGTTDGQPLPQRLPQPLPTNKNDKNVKNDKNIKQYFSRPSVEEVRAYCQERSNTVDAEAFVDFYESKGWKVGNQPMKDWKACVRTWEKRRQAPEKRTAKSSQRDFIQGTMQGDLDLIEQLSFRKAKEAT